MSDVAIGRDGEALSLFGRTTVALLLLIGILAFAGMLVLGAYAPDLRNEGEGGAHALSDAAIGYSGLVRLAEATGRHPHVTRNVAQWRSEPLIVATPESGTVNVSDLVAAGRDRTVLIVFPKWQAVKDDDHPGWVRIADLLPAVDPERMFSPGIAIGIQRHAGGAPLGIAPGLPATLRFVAPAKLQVIVSATPPAHGRPRLQPLITEAHGDIVLGRLDGGNIYVLSDPDLLDNAGMKDPAGAASALALLDWLGGSGKRSIGFDVTLDGLGNTLSPLKLAFAPPFLATTLTIAAAMLLLGIHAFGRFGAPRPRERAIAFGKVALIDNSAALVRKARRTHRLGARYVAAVRDASVRAFGVPARLKGNAIDAYLDGLGGGRRFTDLASAAETAKDAHGLLAAARALHEWKQEKQA